MLYLNKILSNGYGSGIVDIFVPIAQTQARYTLKDKFFNLGKKNKIASEVEVSGFRHILIRGYVTEDFSLTFENKWGSILPNMKGMSNLSQLLNISDGNIASWLSATKASWEGTEPIKIPISFYVFTENENDNILEYIMPLIQLCGVDDSTKATGKSAWNKITSGIRVHGGYYVNVAKSNQDYIQKTREDSYGENATCVLRLGTQCTVSNLLLETIKVSHSNIQVKNGKPLYLKVDCTFRSVGVPTIYDISKIYRSSI